jgi:hypothetical protein
MAELLLLLFVIVQLTADTSQIAQLNDFEAPLNTRYKIQSESKG